MLGEYTQGVSSTATDTVLLTKSIDFICAGASRCGTTTLHDVLRGHPELFLPEKKELRFFDRDAEYTSGLDHYFQHFDNCPDGRLKGEVSPPYFHARIRQDAEKKHVYSEEDSAYRILRDLGKVPIILTLRNPIDRIRSQFLKNLREGRESVETLDEAVREELDGLRDPAVTATCWVYKNRYDLHLRRWLDLFGKEGVLILIFEDWISDPVQMIRAVEGFLDVAPWAEPPDVAPHKNATVNVKKAQAKVGGWKRFRQLIAPNKAGNATAQYTQKERGLLATDTRNRLLVELKPSKDFVDSLTNGRASVVWD